jgi:hypothetical protein
MSLPQRLAVALEEAATASLRLLVELPELRLSILLARGHLVVGEQGRGEVGDARPVALAGLQALRGIGAELISQRLLTRDATARRAQACTIAGSSWPPRAAPMAGGGIAPGAGRPGAPGAPGGCIGWRMPGCIGWPCISE